MCSLMWNDMSVSKRNIRGHWRIIRVNKLDALARLVWECSCTLIAFSFSFVLPFSVTMVFVKLETENLVERGDWKERVCPLFGGFLLTRFSFVYFSRYLLTQIWIHFLSTFNYYSPRPTKYRKANIHNFIKYP